MAQHRTIRMAPGFYRYLNTGAEIVEITRVRQDDGTYWVITIDGSGGHDLYRTLREATDAAPLALEIERRWRQTRRGGI